MNDASTSPLRVLFLCTQNSARSQIAEALLWKKGRGRFLAASAGAQPAPQVHPLAVEVLRERGIDVSEARPKGIEAVLDQPWDFIITVCDRARETCPTRPIFAHSGIPDPAAADGDAYQQRQAFRDTLQYLSRRIDLMLALPFEKLEERAMGERLRAIGLAREVPVREGESWREEANDV